MSDESEGSGSGTLVRGPWSGDSSYTPPPIPDFADTIPAPDDIPEAPPESPEETTMELPPIPASPDPATALRSEGISRPESGEESGECGDGEYAQSRSLADRLGDWLEYRLEVARDRRTEEASFREAEIARKTALLGARTAQEVAGMEQNSKLHAATMKARGDKAAARGKTDTASGMGSDKGRSKAGGTSRGGGGGGSSRNNSGPGSNRSGSRGSNSGGSAGRSGAGATGGGKGGTKGPDRSAGGRGGGSGRNGPSGGSKGSHTGSGGSGRNSGGSAKGDGGRGRHGTAGGARAERARGRQERAGARQSGRQERRTAGHTADVADRTKDRDQARANRQKEWEDRRARRRERDEARKAKREAAAASAPGRTTVGAAVAEEAQRRWDKRRADAKDAKEAKDGAAGAEKVNLSKDKDSKAKGADGKDGKTAKDAPDGASSAAKDGKAGEASGKDSATGDGTKERRFRRRRTGATGEAGRRGRTRRTGRTGRGRTGHAGRRDRPADSSFGPDDSTPTVEWPSHPTGPPPTADSGGQEDIEDAVIVDDPADPSGGNGSSPAGLPRAPEKHTARPGTSRPVQPTTEGSSVSSAKGRRPTGQGGLAAKHRTDITFDEYLMEMANTALQAASDQERAQVLMEAIGKVADALRDMAADLVDDHNIGPAVIDLITMVADAALRMKQHARKASEKCGMANEAARLAATMVARVYGQDMNAKQDAGLRYTSAAAHHD